MRLSTQRTPLTDELRSTVIAALLRALDDDQGETREKRGMTGVRAVAAGAVLYTAGRAAFKHRRSIQERLAALGDDGDEDHEDEEIVDQEDADFEDEALDDADLEDDDEAGRQAAPSHAA